MTLRTIPSLFPLVQAREVFTRQVAKASLMRRLAMAQNWIWSKFTRVYAACGYEGEGNELGRVGSNQSAFYYGYGGESGFGQDPELVKSPDAGPDVLPLVSFVVPPNPGASRRIKVQGRANLIAADPRGLAVVPNKFEVLVGIYTMEGVFTGVWTTTGETGGITTGTDYDWNMTIQVPQDKLYQCRVFLRYVELNLVSDSGVANTLTSTTYSAHSCQVYNVSARYAQAVSTEIGGDTPQTTWQPTADLAQDNYHSLNTAILSRVVQNINHLYTQRGPELCQSWLAKPNNNTSTYVEVGRYTTFSPDKCEEITGRLLVYCTHGGAGNEVRVKVDGVVQQTFAALAAGETELNVTAFTVSTQAEHTITIEAKSTAASADWGTSVYGVSFWESDVDLALPGGTTVPATFQPLDEDALSGDSPIAYKNDLKGRRAGIYYLIQNDRWLANHRLRHLIGDWRHRVYKRYDETTSEERIDWTAGAPGTTDVDGVEFATSRPKNITIRGEGSAQNDIDAYGKFPSGVFDSESSYSAAPFIYPSDLQYALHGRRLGKFWCVPPAGIQTHLGELGSLLLLIRGRRLQPNVLAGDTNGYGPLPEEVNYVGKGYFEVKYGAETQLPVTVPESGDASAPAVRGSGRPATINRTERLWTIPASIIDQGTDQPFIIRGRLPGQRLPYSATPGVARPEGMLFEIELNSVYLADQPLNSQILKDLA